MADGFITFGEKDWEAATPDRRSWMTYETLKSMDARLSKLEKRPLMDKFFSFLGGVIGGFAAILGIKMGG